MRQTSEHGDSLNLTRARVSEYADEVIRRKEGKSRSYNKGKE